MNTNLKAFKMMLHTFQHIYQTIFRITADGYNRITADGDDRITADSDY